MRIAIVHHLVEQFINDYEVVSDGFFLDVFEITFKNFNQCMKKGKYHNGVIVFTGNGYQIKIVMFMEEEEVVVLIFDQGPA